MSGESKTIVNSEELLEQEALRELDEILAENLAIYYDYESVKRYVAPKIKTLEDINEEIRKAGGVESVCTYFNPDVHPPSCIYEDRYPTTKFGDHKQIKRLIRDIKRDIPSSKVMDNFFYNICKRLWEKDPILNNDIYGSSTQEKMDYVESFLQDFENIEDSPFNLDTSSALKNAYDKWLKKCRIIKSHTLEVPKKGVCKNISDTFSNLIFECKYKLGIRGGYKNKKRKSRRRKRKTKKRKSRRTKRKTKKRKSIRRK